MTKQKLNLIGRPVAGASRGVTLVELLVVVAILSIIFAVLIPRLRAVNEDRNIREAARVVASAFSKASSRAINDGSAGLMIVPNPNFRGPTSFVYSNNANVSSPFFAGTRIFQMRRLPPYVGDDESSMAIISGSTVTIPTPFEHDAAANRPVVQINDEISFSGSSHRYRIISVSTNGAMLGLDTTGSAPLPVLGGSGAPFVIHRQPRRLESSLVELPEGYIIDLRYSGPVLSGASLEFGTHLNQNQTDAAGDGPSSIVLQFDASGVVSRMFFEGVNVYGPVAQLADPSNVGSELQMIQPIGALNWLVTEYDPNAIDANGAYLPGQDPLDSPNNKWVTVDHLTGSVNVASGAVPDPNVTNLGTAIGQSQAIARNRQSTSQ